MNFEKAVDLIGKHDALCRANNAFYDFMKRLEAYEDKTGMELIGDARKEFLDKVWDIIKYEEFQKADEMRGNVNTKHLAAMTAFLTIGKKEFEEEG